MGGDDGMNNWVCWGDRDIFHEGGFLGSVRGLSLIIMQVSVIVFHHRFWSNSVMQIHGRFFFHFGSVKNHCIMPAIPISPYHNWYSD